MSAEEGCNIAAAGDESHGSGSEDAAADDIGTAKLEQQGHNEHSVHKLSSSPADCQGDNLSR
jgi:hypothetical protein